MDTLHERCKSLGLLIYQKRRDLAGNREGVRPAKGQETLSMDHVAADIGISKATLSRIERGQVPDLETFRKLCIWLDKSADELLGLNAEKN